MERVTKCYLEASCNPDLHDPARPQKDMPKLLHLSPPELLSRLSSLHTNSRFTLNLSKLSLPDTLELLYICEGRISHLEAFNLKDANYGLASALSTEKKGEIAELDGNYQILNTLQEALNDNNVIALKRAIRTIIWDFEKLLLEAEQKEQVAEDETACKDQVCAELTDMRGRKGTLLDILLHIETLHKFYGPKRPLGSRIGSGSTGQSQLRYGMGLAVYSPPFPPGLVTAPKRTTERANAS